MTFNREICIKILQKASVTCTAFSFRIWVHNLKTKYYLDVALELQCYSSEFLRVRLKVSNFFFFKNSFKAILSLYHFNSVYKLKVCFLLNTKGRSLRGRQSQATLGTDKK